MNGSLEALASGRDMPKGLDAVEMLVAVHHANGEKAEHSDATSCRSGRSRSLMMSIRRGTAHSAINHSRREDDLVAIEMIPSSWQSWVMISRLHMSCCYQTSAKNRSESTVR